MCKYVPVCLFCYMFLVVFIVIDNSRAESWQRQKRFISIRNMSHFFLRFNFKANMVPWTQIFAQALGFRMNWDEPPDSFHPYRNHFLHRRTLYNHVETLLDKNGLNGFQCVRRAICEMETIIKPRSMSEKLLKMVFRQQSSATDKWHNKTIDDCNISLQTCPFSVLEVSTFTDI